MNFKKNHALYTFNAMSTLWRYEKNCVIHRGVIITDETERI